MLQQPLAQELGQPVIIENKPGASGIIGTDQLAKSAPDGHTLLVGITSFLLVNKFLYSKMPLDLEKDLARLYRVSDTGVVLTVNAALPVKTLGDLFKYIEANRGKLSFGSYGLGSYPHLAGERINQLTQGGLAHAAYKGEAPMIQAMLARDIDFGWSSVQPLQQHSERLRPLAVTGPKRLVAASHIPTFAEAGVPDEAFAILGWVGIVVPGKTPDAIKQTLSQAIAKVLSTPSINKRMLDMGYPAVTDSTPQQYEALYQKDMGKWAKLVQSVGVKLD
ncbi:Bug family tripartite tricarboxylate transporter substrate binding protein [Comamonas serinivorans]|uniref:Bug family tripartite tricarboxylate transporter substrate binding protein n=1 Tax=Comamonas serinivorans TaxID=1082851 RepID=UPI0012FB9AE1|nr:tripartite tricarboxylate transporter substrate binding protein [Comamonas serinivorans]